MGIQQLAFLQVALTGLESRYGAGGSDNRSDEQVCSTFKNIRGCNFVTTKFQTQPKNRDDNDRSDRLKNDICNE